jgi:hypothetical protein
VRKAGDPPALYDYPRLITFRKFLTTKVPKQGPFTVRLEPDGQLTYLHWNRVFGPESGTWTVDGNQLCLLREPA